jgi:hypothetical protein
MASIFSGADRCAYTFFCFIQKNFKFKGKVAPGLCLQSPLILHGRAHARNQIFKVLHCMRKVVDVFFKQTKKFCIAGSGHWKSLQLQRQQLCNCNSCAKSRAAVERKEVPSFQGASMLSLLNEGRVAVGGRYWDVRISGVRDTRSRAKTYTECPKTRLRFNKYTVKIVSQGQVEGSLDGVRLSLK